jgi:hypothetical protein
VTLSGFINRPNCIVPGAISRNELSRFAPMFGEHAHACGVAARPVPASDNPERDPFASDVEYDRDRSGRDPGRERRILGWCDDQSVEI